jgi:putative spermidine/putrescine transport system permease protein
VKFLRLSLITSNHIAKVSLEFLLWLMKFLRRPLIATLILYLALPIIMTFLYSFTKIWTDVLPQSFSLDAWTQLLGDTTFWGAISRSLILSFSAVALSIFFLVPTLFAITLYAPKLSSALEFFSLWPFVFPGVIMAVGLIKLFSSPPLAISGTPWLLIPAVTVIVMPYAYRAVSNAFESADVRGLAEAARSLGASDLQILAWVIFPTVLPGVLSGAVLALSASFGEFSLAQLIVGSAWQTLPYYQYLTNSQDGHKSAAITVLAFSIAFVLGALALQLRGDSKDEDTVAVA